MSKLEGRNVRTLLGAIGASSPVLGFLPILAFLSLKEKVPKDDILRLVEKLQTQRNINIDYKNIAGANHFFENKTEKLLNEVSKYLDSRLIGPDF